jgi:hypothetical protein
MCEPPYSVGAEEREAFQHEHRRIGDLLAAGQNGEAELIGSLVRFFTA